MLTAVAPRTRATLAFVVPLVSGVPTIDGTGRLSRIVTRGSPAPQPPLYPVFGALALETGGALLPVGPSSNLSLAFREVLREFRSAYVLYYTARNVDSAGYHTIEVKVPREGVTVQARRGYFGS
jgi:hypothetical protein